MAEYQSEHHPLYSVYLWRDDTRHLCLPCGCAKETLGACALVGFFLVSLSQVVVVVVMDRLGASTRFDESDLVAHFASTTSRYQLR